MNRAARGREYDSNVVAGALRDLAARRRRLPYRDLAARSLRRDLLSFIDNDPRARAVALDTASDASTVWQTGEAGWRPEQPSRMSDRRACVLSRVLVELDDGADSYLAGIAVASMLQEHRLMGVLVSGGLERHHEGPYAEAFLLWAAQAQQRLGRPGEALQTYRQAARAAVPELRRAALASGLLLVASMGGERQVLDMVGRFLDEDRDHQLEVARVVAGVRARRTCAHSVNAGVRRLAETVDHCYHRPRWAEQLLQRCAQ